MQGAVESQIKYRNIIQPELTPTVVATEPSTLASLQKALCLYSNLVGNI
jgi:hypothetical protein